MEDITLECRKNGRVVVRLEVPRPATAADASTVGKAYVQFDSAASAATAVAALDGRTFGPNKVKATFVPEAAFPARARS